MKLKSEPTLPLRNTKAIMKVLYPASQRAIICVYSKANTATSKHSEYLCQTFHLVIVEKNLKANVTA